MRRLIPSATVLAALLLAMVATAPGVTAQDDATAMVEHPLIGTWIVEPTADQPPELATIAPGGIFIEAGPEGTGYGSWVPTGERSADVSYLSPATDPEAGFVGFLTIRASVAVAEDGQSFAGTYTFEPSAAMAEAMGLPAGEFGPGDVTGTRYSAEPMGEPVGPLTEEPPAE